MTEASEASRKRRIGRLKLVLAIALITAYAAAATYGVMSDTTARGLTVKMYTISRSCFTAQTSSVKTLSYTIGGSIWSSSSLPLTLTHVSLTLSVDGFTVGTTGGSTSSFGPGQSTTFSLTITNPTLNPTTLPAASQLILDLAATVTSGIYTSTVSTSDTNLHSFGSTNC